MVVAPPVGRVLLAVPSRRFGVGKATVDVASVLVSHEGVAARVSGAGAYLRHARDGVT